MSDVLGQRIQDALRGPARPVSLAPVFKKLDRDAADLQVMRDDIARAVGFYDCPCGGQFELYQDAPLERYAALNRWLGHHGRCGEPADSEDRMSYAAAMGIVNGLRP